MGAAEITNCTNCVGTFNSDFANGLLELAEACGIVDANSSTSGNSSASANATSSASVSIPTVTASSAPFATGSGTSDALRLVDAISYRVFWATFFVGIAGFVYMLA